MEPPLKPSPGAAKPARSGYVRRILLAALLLYVFLVAVNGLGAGFKALGGGVLDGFFRATANPFLGLVVGLLATSLVQSSSVTTSLIVAMVAAPENPLPLANAVPMIMGANIGTTVTNTVVALGHLARRDEFRRAFAVATCHDFFNWFAVLILLPLEITTGYLRSAASWLADHLPAVGGLDYESPFILAIQAGAAPVRIAASWLAGGTWKALAESAVFGAAIYVSLLLLVRVMRSLLRRRMEGAVTNALDRRPVLAMGIGLVATATIQSSSITTALLVPLAGAGLITLPQAFPVTIGANIGTTVTALLASLAVTGVNARAGVAIALVHLLFNVTASLIIYPLPRIRNIPLSAARWLAATASRRRWLALVYVIGLFYLVPMLLAVLSR